MQYVIHMNGRKEYNKPQKYGNVNSYRFYYTFRFFLGVTKTGGEREREKDRKIYIDILIYMHIYIYQPEQTHHGSRAWRTQRGVAVCPGSV